MSLRIHQESAIGGGGLNERPAWPPLEPTAAPTRAGARALNRWCLPGFAPGRPQRPPRTSSARLVRNPGTPMMFIAETRCWEFVNPSRVRSHAQSRADVEPSRARIPYTGEREFSSATALRADAHSNDWTCYLGAYGHFNSGARTPRPYVPHDIQGAIRPPPSRAHITF